MFAYSNNMNASSLHFRDAKSPHLLAISYLIYISAVRCHLMIQPLMQSQSLFEKHQAFPWAQMTFRVCLKQNTLKEPKWISPAMQGKMIFHFPFFEFQVF